MNIEWGVMCVKPGSEIDISRRLLVLGFEVYAPRIITRKNNRYSKTRYDRFHFVRTALYPGYFFFRADWKFNTAPLPAHMEDEVRMLRARDGRLLTISEEEIASIKVTESEAVEKPEQVNVWSKNETVRILGEAFRGTKPKITHVRAKSALVSINANGLSNEFYVRLTSLRKA